MKTSSSTCPGSSRRAGKKVGVVECSDGCLLKLGDLKIIFMILYALYLMLGIPCLKLLIS